MKQTLQIRGMNCGHCAAKVEKALSGVSGVTSVAVALDANTAEVEYDESAATKESMAQAVADAGYEVSTS